MDHPRDELPDPALFWRWVGRATRPVVGWALTGIGALALLVGYLGISREAIVAKQIPYLISGGIGGLALLIVGAVFLGTEDVRRDTDRLDRLERMVEQLHAALLVRDPAAADDIVRGAATVDVRTAQDPQPAPPAQAAHALDTSWSDHVRVGAAPGDVVVLPQGKSFHRAECVMVEGKPKAETVPASDATSRGLEPCRLCEPHLVGA